MKRQFIIAGVALTALMLSAIIIGILGIEADKSAATAFARKIAEQEAIKAGWITESQIILTDTDYYFDRVYRFTFVVRDSRMDVGVVFVDVAGGRGVWGMSLFNAEQDFRLASSAVEIHTSQSSK